MRDVSLSYADAACPPVGCALAPHLRGLPAAAAGHDDSPVVACDLASAQRCLADWAARFPGVHASTSAQALGSRPLTRLLALSGHVSFRAYSKSDLDAALSAGVPGHAVLLANPCKTRGLIGHARRAGVGVTAFDSAPELARLAAAWPEAELLLLVRPPGTGTGRRRSGHQLGASPEDCPGLLAAARDLGLRVAGLAIWLGDDDCDEDEDDKEEEEDENKDCLAEAQNDWTEAAALATNLLAAARRLGHPQAAVVDLGCLSQRTLARRALPAFAAGTEAGLSPRLLCDLTPALLAEAVVMATRVLAKAVEQLPAGGFSYRLSGGAGGADSGARICGLVGDGGGGGGCRVPSRLAEGCDPLMLPELSVGDWLLWRRLRTCPTAARVLHCLQPGEFIESGASA